MQIEKYHSVDIFIPFGKLGSMLDWCKTNCSGDWKFSEESDFYTFYFENPQDCVTFKIWKM